MFKRICTAAVFALITGLGGLVTPHVAHSDPAGDPTKVKALIIGVSDYKLLGKEKALPRSIADATELGRTLVDTLKVPSDNVVILTDNPTRDQIRKAWERHLASLKPRDVSIFFFSGHGAQHNGQQYLLPSDFNANSAADYTGVSLVEVVNKLRSSDRRNLGIFIIDACRTRSPAKAAGTGVKSDETSGGVETAFGDSFAPTRAPEGTFIFYAASVNQMALHDLGNGDNEPYSVYSRVLLPLIMDLNRGLHDVAKDVRWETYTLALSYKTVEGVGKPQLQIPAYFDDALQRTNILGQSLPSVRRPPVARAETDKGKAPGPLAGMKNVWACKSCPEMVDVPVSSTPIVVRGGAGTAQVSSGATVDKPYSIGKYEVTREEWGACQADKICVEIAKDIIEGDRHPITGVTWKDTQDFIRWLNTKSGITGFRMPREAEWEHAARGGSSSDYGPANEERQLCDFANGADASLKTLAWANLLCNDGKARGTTTAGSYRPNHYGAHDMQGNVWEWVDACYDAACTLRVAKGGSWRSGPEALKIGAFQAFASDVPRDTVGFRVARDLD